VSGVNKIIELGKGIYQFGPISKPVEKENLRIFVHPYGRGGCYEDNLPYVKTRDRIIRKENSPIIMLVDEKDLSATIERYKKPLFKNYRMIVLTEDCDSELKTRSWEELKDFIKSEFNPRKLFISGAELILDRKNKPWGGCVGTLYLQLKDFSPETQLESCYVL